jgi:hypothetical protein
MIKKVTIYGDICSGTNYLEELLVKNFDVKIVWTYGWKHFFGFNNLSNSDDVLFIGIVRNIVDWVNSVHRKKWHLPESVCKNINSLLNNKYYCINKRNKQEIMEARNIETNKKYKNIFESRHTKNKFLIEKMPLLVKNYCLITYDELKNNFTSTMNIIKSYNLEIKNNIEFPINNKYYKKTNRIFKDKENVIDKDMILSKANLFYEKILFPKSKFGLYNTITNTISNTITNTISNTITNTISNTITEPPKYALLIGINYIDTRHQLHGCINDVIFMKKYLIEKRGYLSDNIIVLRDDNTSFMLPNKSNIINKFTELINNANTNNSTEIFFHYSGHCLLNKDEKREYICPVDFDFICYEEIRSLLSNLNNNTTLLSVIDACFSNAVMDLQVLYNQVSNKIENNKIENINLSDKKIYSLSGHRNDQINQTNTKIYNVYSTPTIVDQPDNRSGGALTSTLLELLNNTNTNDFTNILRDLQTNLKNSYYEQIPQLLNTFNTFNTLNTFNTSKNSKIKCKKKNLIVKKPKNTVKINTLSNIKLIKI